MVQKIEFQTSNKRRKLRGQEMDETASLHSRFVGSSQLGKGRVG